jgi:hypothetical protein
MGCCGLWPAVRLTGNLCFASVTCRRWWKCATIASADSARRFEPQRRLAFQAFGPDCSAAFGSLECRSWRRSRSGWAVQRQHTAVVIIPFAVRAYVDAAVSVLAGRERKGLAVSINPTKSLAVGGSPASFLGNSDAHQQHDRCAHQAGLHAILPFKNSSLATYAARPSEESARIHASHRPVTC